MPATKDSFKPETENYFFDPFYKKCQIRNVT